METQWLLLLKYLLCQIQSADEAKGYEMRAQLVWDTVSIAGKLGYKVGVRLDPAEPEWPVVFIELPTGQVSWHMQQYPTPWDGHTTEQKYERIRQFVEGKGEESR